MSDTQQSAAASTGEDLRAVADIWRAVWTNASLRSNPHVVTLGRLLAAAGYDMEEVRRVAGTE